MADVNAIQTGIVVNTNKLTTLTEIQKESVLAENILFSNDASNVSLYAGIQSEAVLKALDDIERMAELPARNEAEQKEFAEKNANAEIAGIGFLGLNDEDAEYVLKVQDTFDNDDKTTLSAYRYTKNFDPKFYSLVLSNGIIFPDDNEDCKVDD